MFMRGVSFGKLTGAVCDTVAQNKTKMIDNSAESIIMFMRGSKGASKKQLAANKLAPATIAFSGILIVLRC